MFWLTCAIAAVVAASAATRAADLIYAKDGSGYFGCKDMPKLRWCARLVHDPDRPAPLRVEPGPPSTSVPPPADAVWFFCGTEAAAWTAPHDWKIDDGCLVAGNVTLTTREHFGDIQLHLEWQSRAVFAHRGRTATTTASSLMGHYEIQIFDSSVLKIYPDGARGAIYGQTPPRVDASRVPGQRHSYDIVFVAPRFANGKPTAPARVTVFRDGVRVQHDQEFRGQTGHRILPISKTTARTGQLALGGHGCRLRFRNIWLQRL